MAPGPTEPKTTSTMRPPRWLFIGFLLALCGCVSQIMSLREYTKAWVGQPIERKAASIGWKETTYSLDNGNRVYVEPDRKDCFIHWEVNPEGIIVGSRTEGKGCW